MPKSVKAPMPELRVEMKIGILHTIAKSIYESPERKIREAVANSIDNQASLFVCFADPSTRTLSLFDNGTGITKKRFQEIFSNLGYGLAKEELSSLSYFGLGLMSIIQLGKKATIFTRSINEKTILKLQIDTKTIFDKDNEKKPLSFIEKCIPLEESNLIARSALSPLTDSDIKNTFNVFPQFFTEIVIEDVFPQDLKFLRNGSFEETIRKLLPLKPDEKDPFFNRIKDNKAKNWIQDLFANVKYCPTIDFYYGVSGERQLKQLWRYFPDFKTEWESGNTNISYGIGNGGFAYYILYTIGAMQEELTDVGFWVRNRNFLVKPADFLEQPGKRNKIIHEPLKNWIYAEIFHENMNNFLMVSRNEYIWDSPEFRTFYDAVAELVSPLNKELRQAYEYGSKIVNDLITPFADVGEKKGPFYRASKTIASIGIPCDGADALQVLSELKKKRRPELEKDNDRIDTLMKKSTTKILLADDENSLVTIDPAVSKEDVYTKTWDPLTQKIVVNISPSLFAPKKVIFIGKTFEVIFVAGKESDGGISVNVDDGKIFVNPFNHDMLNYTVSFIDVYVAVELADIMAATKEEMKRYLLQLLGTKYVTSGKDYLSPLSDDLQRKKRSR